MNDSHSFNRQDNLSIQIDPDIFDKPDSQLTEQLYQMARRIAESDRNNQAYRQSKKSKSFEVEMLKRNKQELDEQMHKIQAEIVSKRSKQQQNNFTKNNRTKFQQINTICEDLAVKQKQIQKNTCQVLKENEKLQKKLAVLQVQYQIITKQNKHKANMVIKLQKQKDEKTEIMRQNQKKINQLELQCQQTKIKAENLQQQLKQELRSQKQLQNLIRQKQIQLEKQKKQSEETSKKQEENKRNLAKMGNMVRVVEMQIQGKLKEADKLQNTYQMLKSKISTMEQQQKKLEEFMSNRRNIINHLKGMVSKVGKQQEALSKIKNNKGIQDIEYDVDNDQL